MLIAGRFWHVLQHVEAAANRARCRSTGSCCHFGAISLRMWGPLLVPSRPCQFFWASCICLLLRQACVFRSSCSYLALSASLVNSDCRTSSLAAECRRSADDSDYLLARAVAGRPIRTIRIIRGESRDLSAADDSRFSALRAALASPCCRCCFFPAGAAVFAACAGLGRAIRILLPIRAARACANAGSASAAQIPSAASHFPNWSLFVISFLQNVFTRNRVCRGPLHRRPAHSSDRRHRHRLGACDKSDNGAKLEITFVIRVFHDR